MSDPFAGGVFTLGFAARAFFARLSGGPAGDSGVGRV